MLRPASSGADCRRGCSIQARLTRPLVGDGQIDGLHRSSEDLCQRRPDGLQPFLAARRRASRSQSWSATS